ncbi:MAG: CRISPR-associated endoribonuclease Cas6 [Fimbriimonadia bacterium]|nr:CRISPR-associated endoribonuclease Cas6 [Fimbriimonadia bacterium]
MKAIVMTLKQVNQEPLPPSHGAFAYAAALELLVHIDPVFVTHLHDAQAAKPLTVSPLFPVENEHNKPPTFHWRLTALERDTARLLTQLSQERSGGVRIGHSVFAVSDIATTPEQHPDAGEQDYLQMFERWGRAEPPAAFTLRFITPTTFKAGAQEAPYPLPRLVFGSLMDNWTQWSPIPMGEWRALLERAIFMSNWRGETRRVDLGARYVTGFIGKFTYRPTERSRDLQRMMGMLAEYAPYAGIGWQTTHGLGQVRVNG